MKARNPSTGQLKEIYVKAVDCMPIGATMDYAGDNSNLPAGWEIVPDYSTDELDTGKIWIDGSKIYRKCFTGTLSSSGTATLIVTGISKLINVGGYAEYVSGSNHYQFPISSSFGTTGQNDIRLIKSSTANQLSLQAGSGLYSQHFEVWAEYTKTS